MNNPKISIITITYNSEKTLEETIKSIISQGYDNLEYLIIDGGSTDHTLDIVNKYRNNIAVVVSEPDNGISDAFNKGIRYATGEIIGIINSDDILLSGALQAISDSYNKNVAVYRGNTIVWNDISNAKTRIRPTMKMKLSKPIGNVCHQSTFVTKSCYETLGAYNIDFKYMMDADILYLFYRAGVVFKYVDYDMALFRLGGVTNTNYKKKLKEIHNVVIVNGGSNILAEFRCFHFIVYNMIKALFYKVAGGDIARKIRYHF